LRNRPPHTYILVISVPFMAYTFNAEGSAAYQLGLTHCGPLAVHSCGFRPRQCILNPSANELDFQAGDRRAPLLSVIGGLRTRPCTQRLIGARSDVAAILKPSSRVELHQRLNSDRHTALR
jgi:hypothetical protein